MTEIFVKSMQLTAVLNKVSVSIVLLTLIKYKVFFQFKVSLKCHMHEEYGNFIREKFPISACLVISQNSLHLLDLGCNAVACCIAACF